MRETARRDRAGIPPSTCDVCPHRQTLQEFSALWRPLLRIHGQVAVCCAVCCMVCTAAYTQHGMMSSFRRGVTWAFSAFGCMGHGPPGTPRTMDRAMLAIASASGTSVARTSCSGHAAAQTPPVATAA